MVVGGTGGAVIGLFEERFHLVEKAFALGVFRVAAFLGKFFKQLFLL